MNNFMMLLASSVETVEAVAGSDNNRNAFIIALILIVAGFMVAACIAGYKISQNKKREYEASDSDTDMDIDTTADTDSDADDAEEQEGDYFTTEPAAPAPSPVPSDNDDIDWLLSQADKEVDRVLESNELFNDGFGMKDTERRTNNMDMTTIDRGTTVAGGGYEFPEVCTITTTDGSEYSYFSRNARMESDILAIKAGEESDRIIREVAIEDIAKVTSKAKPGYLAMTLANREFFVEFSGREIKIYDKSSLERLSVAKFVKTAGISFNLPQNEEITGPDNKTVGTFFNMDGSRIVYRNTASGYETIPLASITSLQVGAIYLEKVEGKDYLLYMNQRSNELLIFAVTEDKVVLAYKS